MTNPITAATIENMVGLLHIQARKAGLMEEGQILIYESGVAAGGVPPAVWLDRRGERPSFLPYFEMINRREQYTTLQGALYALMAVNSRP